VFVRAGELGADATQLAPTLDAAQALQQTLEEIRCKAAVLLGLTPSLEQAHQKFQHTPKVVLVAPPAAYTASSGKKVDVESIDLLARAISMRNTHRTFPGTVAMCTALAAQVEGTVVHEVVRRTATHDIRIGHPAGVMAVGATVSRRGGDWYAERVTTKRTARRIMEGAVLVPQKYLDGTAWFEAQQGGA
jgi:2-methylaconitate cis-trans-isomerase PrpF